MSSTSEAHSLDGGLGCDLCNYLHFPTRTEWKAHQLNHLGQPVVSLVKLNKKLCSKLLQGRSYVVNTGVARKSRQHVVPPLKISIIKQGDCLFTVKQETSYPRYSPRLEEESDSDSRSSEEDFWQSPSSEEKKVEGKELLERLGASFSISRKGAPATPAAAAGKKPDVGNTSPTSSAESKKDNLLERLTGIGGISISAVSKCPSTETKPSTTGVSISSKAKSLELSHFKALKDQASEIEKPYDHKKLFEKLTGSGISIASRPLGKSDDGKDTRGEKGEEERSPRPESYERGGPSSLKSNKSDDSNDSFDSKNSVEGRASQIHVSEDIGRPAGETSAATTAPAEGISGERSGEHKKFVRVKRSAFKKSKLPLKETSMEESAEDRSMTGGDEGKEKPRETGIDILERLTDNLNNTVGAEKPAETSNLPDCDSVSLEDPLAITTDLVDLHRDFNAEESSTSPSSQFQIGGDQNSQDRSQVEALLLSTPGSSGHEEDNSDFVIGQTQAEHFDEHDNVSEDNNEVTENPMSFSALSNEDQGSDQGEQPTAFWPDIPTTSSSVDQPQEDPLLTPENPVSNGDQNFIHNFSNDYQPSTSHDNSEFMSLDRLGQRFSSAAQHPPPPPYVADTSSPMEHLSQQVQRIPNPTPQINVISQHHLQAPPPPPQLHTGVTLSPQHISPQASSYESLHIQPPLPPPPLYQGYMYNQTYAQQQMSRAPQPQMPLLQQRPHIQARGYQPMPAPQQRPRPRAAVKRSPVRAPQEMISSPKQPRLNPPPMQVRTQLATVTPKISGITITPPKKALEATKVANVLAQRGITVTPSRQASQAARPQQSRAQPIPSGPSSINISSTVSLAPPNQNRVSGGFAVPPPRRSVPIVNHQAERPERCMTVDLTQDDDIPQSSMRNRFGCHLCGKMFNTSTALATHKSHHRGALPYNLTVEKGKEPKNKNMVNAEVNNVRRERCDLCSGEYSNIINLVNHRQACSRKMTTPDLAIPIVDLNQPGARDQLRKCGVMNFIPLAQLQSNNNGYFGIPIIQVDTAKEKAVSNLSLLGAGNILVLGKMKAINSQGTH